MGVKTALSCTVDAANEVLHATVADGALEVTATSVHPTIGPPRPRKSQLPTDPCWSRLITVATRVTLWLVTAAARVTRRSVVWAVRTVQPAQGRRFCSSPTQSHPAGCGHRDSEILPDVARGWRIATRDGSGDRRATLSGLVRAFQTYAKPVGASVQVPEVAVRMSPPVAAPETVGNPVLEVA